MYFLYNLSFSFVKFRTTFLIVDVTFALILHFVRKDVEKRRETEKLGLMKKNDELHEQKKADERALKSNEREKKRYEQNNRGNYKTHEKRNHHPPQHHIQQPKK